MSYPRNQAIQIQVLVMDFYIFYCTKSIHLHTERQKKNLEIKNKLGPKQRLIIFVRICIQHDTI